METGIMVTRWWELLRFQTNSEAELPDPHRLNINEGWGESS